MAINFAKIISSAASTGLVLGALAGCSGSQGSGAAAPRRGGSPSAEEPADDAEATAGDAAEDKACCKGMNACKGKGGCATNGHDCAGKNECAGKGGCNGHCPK